MRLLAGSALCAALGGLSACRGDETLNAYAQDNWQLVTLNGDAVPTGITLSLVQPGRISGAAPCNRYSAAQTAPYPWFEAGPIAATRRACADLATEQAYFSALAAMTFAEAQGNVLILSNGSGGALVFQSVP